MFPGFRLLSQLSILPIPNFSLFRSFFYKSLVPFKLFMINVPSLTPFVQHSEVQLCECSH